MAGGCCPLCLLEKPEDIGQVYQTGKPAQVIYNEIVWPEAVSGIFRLELLRSIYGPPYERTKRKTRLNLSLWAAWSIDRLKLVFDARIGRLPARGKGRSRERDVWRWRDNRVGHQFSSAVRGRSTAKISRWPKSDLAGYGS